MESNSDIKLIKQVVDDYLDRSKFIDFLKLIDRVTLNKVDKQLTPHNLVYDYAINAFNSNRNHLMVDTYEPLNSKPFKCNNDVVLYTLNAILRRELKSNLFQITSIQLNNESKFNDCMHRNYNIHFRFFSLLGESPFKHMHIYVRDEHSDFENVFDENDFYLSVYRFIVRMDYKMKKMQDGEYNELS